MYNTCMHITWNTGAVYPFLQVYKCIYIYIKQILLLPQLYIYKTRDTYLPFEKGEQAHNHNPN